MGKDKKQVDTKMKAKWYKVGKMVVLKFHKSTRKILLNADKKEIRITILLPKTNQF